MTFRTDGEIILASNMSQDLTNLVVAYLELYKKYAQGLNNVRIPDERYTVVFRKMTEQGMLPVKLVYTKTTTWEEPDYYDVDSDYYSESWGSSNISGYTTRSEQHIVEYDIAIPFSALLRSKEDMIERLIARVEKDKVEKEEAYRLSEIAKHEAAIAKLKQT